MPTIIAARVQTQEDVAYAITRLTSAGIEHEKVSSFFVNPAGQHDAFALGGDHDKSPGAEKSGSGIAQGMGSGSVIGAVAGIASTAVVGPLGPVVGALLGAHAGGLVGAMSSMKESSETDPPANVHDYHEVPRRSGMLVAVQISSNAEQMNVITCLREIGAEDVESTSGTITAGKWTDFDPLSPCVLVPEQVASTPHTQ